jgi:uncharacterized membrane protein (UPF0127 family)
MDRTDLSGYDGMVFRFDTPVANEFYMYKTLLALSIAWVDADGRVTGVSDMDPCRSTDAAACRRYPPPAPYLHAVEVERGRAAAMGLVTGAAVRFTGTCIPPGVPVTPTS